MRPNGIVFVLGCVALAACGSREASSERPAGTPAYAVLTELGTRNLQMQPGSNVRIMKGAEISDPARIAYDTVTGILTLRHGLYRISGYSISTFGYERTPAQDSAAFSAPGYAYLCNVDAGGIQTLGSMQDPLYSLPSRVDDVVAVPEAARFYLGHQNGAKVGGIYLETFVPDIGTDHVFARLVVERMGDVPAGTTTKPAQTSSGHACWPLDTAPAPPPPAP